jgi:nucleotide-binding universal stress UspA family protein
MFNTFVWATDGSENADRALAVAKPLARENRAALVVAHIVERYATKVGLGVYPDEQQVEAKLKQLVDELSGEGLKRQPQGRRSHRPSSPLTRSLTSLVRREPI